MSYKFLKQPIAKGYYEPEGIYLTLPLETPCHIIQAWGEHHEFYAAYTYNGVPLKGHNGIDIQAEAHAPVIAIDRGKVISIGVESPGWGRYVKVEHEWGESLYAHLGRILVDAGQYIAHSQKIAMVEPLLQRSVSGKTPSYLHLGIRINPYNRFDGWGGFVDPVPYLESDRLIFNAFPEHAEDALSAQNYQQIAFHPMLIETGEKRRP